MADSVMRLWKPHFRVCRLTKFLCRPWINHHLNISVLSLRNHANLLLQTSPWKTITVWIGLKTHCDQITDNVFGGGLRQILPRYNEDVNAKAFSLSSLSYMQCSEVMLLQLIKYANLTYFALAMWTRQQKLCSCNLFPQFNQQYLIHLSNSKHIMNVFKIW